MFLGRPNPVQARVLSGWGIVPLFSEEQDLGEGLKKLLESLAREVERPADGAEPAAKPAPPRKAPAKGKKLGSTKAKA